MMCVLQETYYISNLFIGRLAFYKNLGVVIRSFVDFVKIVPDARLVIVGAGPMLSKWRKMSSDFA
jgi:glycosyltransferase involved in cell wall biosynthesis